MMQSLIDKARIVLCGPPVPNEPEKAVDPTMIMTFISGIISMIRGCSSQATAQERIKEGGPVAMGAALKIVRDNTDLKGKSRRDKAAELVKAGQELTTEEMQELLGNAKDIPVESPPTGIWPVAMLLVGFLLCSSACQAQEGIWPIDEVQNQRLDKLESDSAKTQSSLQAIQAQLDNITDAVQKINAPQPAVATVKSDAEAYNEELASIKADLHSLALKLNSPQPTPTPTPVPCQDCGKQQAAAKPSKATSTKVAAALNHAPAYQMIGGQTVHTTDEHLLFHGYTREQIAGLSADQKDRLHGAAHGTAAMSAPAQVQIASPQVQYETQCNGRSCRRVRRRG